MKSTKKEQGIRCIIVDDEPLAHRVIVEYAQDVSYLDIVAQVYLPTDAIDVIEEQAIDLMFLDIKMPKMTGLEMLRLVNGPPCTIITSAYQEYGVESYEFEVCDYLLKPFRFDRFLQAVQKARSILEVPSAENHNDDLYVKVDKKLIKIGVSEIRYLEAYGNYTKVWSGDSFHLVPQKISDFGHRLGGESFYRIHKSFLIHSKHIDFVEGNSLRMSNGIFVPISKHQKGDFMAWLAEMSR